jgi:VIT1/CCC1 family predicted Fe2+/Mn2+ transporter|tara:strand:+ start:892 stop:1047 length:156 start_codon:yes stop_codon:yes gene_type:complete
MPAIIAFLTKTFLTEKIMKAVMIALGDYLVASSKNKLDDKLWDKVKKIIAK